MQIARITAKGQMTIPVSIRKAAHFNAGDTLAFEIKGDYLIVRKTESPAGIEERFNEWYSPEDEEACSGL